MIQVSPLKPTHNHSHGLMLACTLVHKRNLCVNMHVGIHAHALTMP